MTIIMLKCVNFDFYFNGCRCCGIFNLIILPSNFYYLSNQYTLSHTCQTHFLKMSTHYLYLKISHTSLFLLDCLSIFFPTLILVVVQYHKKNQILSLVFFFVLFISPCLQQWLLYLVQCVNNYGFFPSFFFKISFYEHVMSGIALPLESNKIYMK